MPTAGWLRRVDLPLDAAGRSYIDPPNLDQILDQFVNWRGAVNGGGQTLSNAVLTGVAISTTGITVTGTVPVLALQDTDAPVDEKLWKFYVDGGDLNLLTPNDADNATGSFFTMTRTGTVPGLMQLNAGIIVLKGSGPSIGYPGDANAFAGWFFNQYDINGQHGLACGSRYRAASVYSLMVGSVYNLGSGFQLDFAIDGTGDIVTPLLRTTYPGAGSKKWWADPSAGYAIKFAI